MVSLLLILKFKRTICSVATCVFVLRPFRGPSCVVRSHVQRASEHWQSSALPNLNLSVCVIGLIWLCTGSELVSIATNLNLAVWADHHHCMFRSATVCSGAEALFGRDGLRVRLNSRGLASRRRGARLPAPFEVLTGLKEERNDAGKACTACMPNLPATSRTRGEPRRILPAGD